MSERAVASEPPERSGATGSPRATAPGGSGDGVPRSGLDLALETVGLRKHFGDLVAVDGIDLAVPRGSFYGFLGPNGAGKSTTIKCLTGLLQPSGGACRILGLDPFTDPVSVKRKVGVVPEDLAQVRRRAIVHPTPGAGVEPAHGLRQPRPRAGRDQRARQRGQRTPLGDQARHHAGARAAGGVERAGGVGADRGVDAQPHPQVGQRGLGIRDEVLEAVDPHPLGLERVEVVPEPGRLGEGEGLVGVPNLVEGNFKIHPARGGHVEQVGWLHEGTSTSRAISEHS